MSKRPRKPRERIDAEAARELLHQQRHDDEPTAGSERDAKLWWLIQHRVGFEKSERSDRLCELHSRLWLNPADTSAAAEQQTIFEEINDEAIAQLEEIDRAIRAGTRPGYFPKGTPAHE
jgi:hypothetical protein